MNDSIALLTCGSSIVDSWGSADRSLYKYFVGVNWVGCHYGVHWLCVSDMCVLEDDRFGYPVRGFVSSSGVPKERDDLEYLSFSRWGNVRGWMGKPVCQYTFPNALKWCLEQSAGLQVDVYGLDMDDGKGICRDDWNHCGSRWSRELPWLNALFREYGERIRLVGCGVDEILLRP